MRTKKRDIYLFLLLLCTQAVSAECDLEKTPLIRDSNCAWYIKEDKALNSEYKKLSKMLNKDIFTMLKKNRGNGYRGETKGVKQSKKK